MIWWQQYKWENPHLFERVVSKNKEDKGMNSEQMYHNNVLQEWYDDNNTNEKIHICLEELLKHHMHRKKTCVKQKIN